jgi:radical SAM superfamily enzyme YgiQ (UPF0313 family)
MSGKGNFIMINNNEYGKKTWKQINFKNILSDSKKNRIIGLSFPENDNNLGLEPSILTVLPEGDNVEFSLKNIEFNDNNVKYYICSVYITGYDEFKQWAIKHDINKIIVGGYHPTSFPNDFKRYAYKIVLGPCDDFYETIKQEGQIVHGIINYKKIPRYDLYGAYNNQQIIPDKNKCDVVVSVNTSQGCPYACDFCCTPMMSPKLISKPIYMIQKEIDYHKNSNPKFIFIRDENFPLQNDWKERLKIINQLNAKIYLFASANLLNEENIKFMKENGVYMICLGLEDITVEYNKNKKLDEVCELLKKYGIYKYLSFIVNPLKIVGREQGEEFYKKLMNRFYELKPEMICGNFLMPFRGTKLWDEYYHLISEDDYKYYNSKSAFLIKNEIVRKKMEFFMFYYQWLYYTSDFYRENIRKFEIGDTLYLRFVELYKEFIPKYEKIWDVRP